jgi:hypothetical protein
MGECPGGAEELTGVPFEDLAFCHRPDQLTMTHQNCSTRVH